MISLSLSRLLLLPSSLLVHALRPSLPQHNTGASHLLARRDSNADSSSTPPPPPISINPDQNWDGIDGLWSSFTLRIGTPEQFVRAFVSFSSYQTWAILPQGCQAAASYTACANSRGWIYNESASTTFDRIGLYDLSVARNLGYGGNAIYGYETVGLGGVGEGGPTLQNTTVGGMAAEDFYLGVLGINPKPTNFTSFNDPSPSYMTLLKEQNYIPSVSFGYHAGAKYRFKGVLASLVLGGYDANKFVDNDITFNFAADNERDIVVAIQSITTLSQIESSPTPTELLPSPIYAYIDSTVPEIWLPIEACDAFEIEFGLVYDNDTALYLVNDTLHESLLERDANITFFLAQGHTGGPQAQITLPYAAFDLTAKPPYRGFSNDTRYFPLRRAANDTQYTLGRTFLQEAYITVDWESARFNVSQMQWVDSASQNLVAIIPATDDATGPGTGIALSTEGSNSSGGLSAGAIAGAAVGVVAAIAIATVLLFGCRRRKRREAATRLENEKLGDDGSSRPNTGVSSGRTNRQNSAYRKAELEGSSTPMRQDRRLLSAHGSTAPGTPYSTVSPSSPGYFMTSGGVSSPATTTPSSGEGTHSSSESGHMFSPLSATASEAHNSERPIYEMPGDMPIIREKDGRALSEKEALQYREQMYNGIASTTPTSSEGRRGSSRGPRRINPENVVTADLDLMATDLILRRQFSFEMNGDEGSTQSSGREHRE